MSDAGGVNPKYQKLFELLSKEKYPLEYPVKIIGKNTLVFAAGLARFEGEHPGMRRTGERKSEGDRHLAVTYVVTLSSALHGVGVMERAAAVPDAMVTL